MMTAEGFAGLGTVAGERLHGAAVEARALHETGFFRDREVFEVLRETALPRIIEVNHAVRRLRVWCAGCSTGQEAYSMAMLLRESFADQLANWDVKIVATDVASDAVAYAERGRYRRAEVNRGLPARLLVKYFSRDGEEWEVTPEMRGICDFREIDVCAPTTDSGQYDLVLMRNVLLLLREEDHAAVFDGLHRQMAAHGVLVLGQAEQAEDSTQLFEAEYVRGCCLYRKATRK